MSTWIDTTVHKERYGQLCIGDAFGGDRGVNQPRILLRVGGNNYNDDQEHVVLSLLG
jgi:hypothetical protein